MMSPEIDDETEAVIQEVVKFLKEVPPEKLDAMMRADKIYARASILGPWRIDAAGIMRVDDSSGPEKFSCYSFMRAVKYAERNPITFDALELAALNWLKYDGPIPGVVRKWIQEALIGKRRRSNQGGGIGKYVPGRKFVFAKAAYDIKMKYNLPLKTSKNNNKITVFWIVAEAAKRCGISKVARGKSVCISEQDIKNYYYEDVKLFEDEKIAKEKESNPVTFSGPYPLKFKKGDMYGCGFSLAESKEFRKLKGLPSLTEAQFQRCWELEEKHDLALEKCSKIINGYDAHLDSEN